MATQALRRKKAAENQLDQLAGQRLQLEMQVNTIESANLNAETMLAMKKGSDALKAIHGNMSVMSLFLFHPFCEWAVTTMMISITNHTLKPEPLARLTRR